MNLTGTLDLKEIIQLDFPQDQYIREEQPKSQIVLHHSAGWDNARGMFAGWKADKQRVATCLGLVDDGTLYQAFPSKYWAYHVNIMSKGNPDYLRKIGLGKYANMATYTAIEKRTIGIEVCNWGQLHPLDGKYHTWASSAINPKYSKEITVPENKVVEYPEKFRGFQFYEKYTDRELESLWRLLRYWCDRYGISKTYHHEMWDVAEGALDGSMGITAHVSFRFDKFDIHPQPEVIQMLQAL